MVNNKWGTQNGEYDIETVTIRTVDQAVHDYFDKKLNLTVDTGDKSRNKVSVIFAGSERWKAIRSDNGLRDDNGTLILPLLAVRRTDINRDKGFGGMASEQPYISVSRKKTTKLYDFLQRAQQREANGFPKIKEVEPLEYFTLPFPDFCTMLYEITVWAQYQSQMNDIIEQLVYNYDYSDSFYMPVEYNDSKVPEKNGYYFIGFLQGDFLSDTNFDDMTDSERVIRYSFSMRVPVYLMLNPASEPTAYGRDKGRRSSRNAPIVYRQEGIAQIALTENIVGRIATSLSGAL